MERLKIGNSFLFSSPGMLGFVMVKTNPPIENQLKLEVKTSATESNNKGQKKILKKTTKKTLAFKF